MNLDTALNFVRDHFNHAKETYPHPKDPATWSEHIAHRLADAEYAIEETALPDHKLIAGKRALQVAAMALRMIDDLDLGMVGPDYDTHLIPHTPVD